MWATSFGAEKWALNWGIHTDLKEAQLTHIWPIRQTKLKIAVPFPLDFNDIQIWQIIRQWNYIRNFAKQIFGEENKFFSKEKKKKITLCALFLLLNCVPLCLFALYTSAVATKLRVVSHIIVYTCYSFLAQNKLLFLTIHVLFV